MENTALERVQNFEEAFNKIKSATGITDIEELVRMFIKNEDHNFSLFNYVNEQNNEIEKVEKLNRKESIIWLLRNGTPWFLKRSVDLLPAALILMAIEYVNSKLNRVSGAESENVSFASFAVTQDFEELEISELRVS
jgi:uncharacterized membrane protein YgaE (UPF0421/DUF939 family)